MLLDERGTPYVKVMSKKNPEKLLIQVEYYLEADPRAPEAYARFLSRLQPLSAEYDQWKTIVIDSVTYLELVSRMQQKYFLNPGTKEPRQWFAGSTDQVEEILLMRFGALPMNVVVVAHVDEDKDQVHGNFVRNPSAPGRMRKKVGSGFSEFYYAYVAKDASGQLAYQLQTRKDEQYNAGSGMVQAPDPCYPDFKDLWLPEIWGGQPKPPIHSLVYGESGAGKSTFAATWPKPMLVFMFDPLNKEAPYLRRGDVVS